MILHRKDIEKITAALEQFSDVDAFELDVQKKIKKIIIPILALVAIIVLPC